jgi:hypothetical protein
MQIDYAPTNSAIECIGKTSSQPGQAIPPILPHRQKQNFLVKPRKDLA